MEPTLPTGIVLEWKPYPIQLQKLIEVLKNLIGTNYDGLMCGESSFEVVYKEMPTESEREALNTFWTNATEMQFSPSLKEILSGKINQASAFGRALILDFAVENVQIGITQAGKTRPVADYCRAVQRYLESGSLYAAVEQLNEMIATGAPPELSPFVTNTKLTTYRDKILTYLSTA